MRWPWQKPEQPEPDPAPVLSEPYTPRWEYITSSDVWQSDLQPLLEQMRQEVFWKMLQVDPSKAAEVAKLQGAALAYHNLLQRPIDAQAIKKHLEAERAKFEEKVDDGRRGFDAIERRYSRRA